MAARPRKKLNPKSKDFSTRFARHLRALLDERGLGPTAFLERLLKAGLDVSDSTVKKWLSGDRLPMAQDFEVIGGVLGLEDYRQAMPPPR